MTTTTAAPATTQSQSPVETQSPIDTLKRGIAVGVAALGSLVPAAGALGHGNGAAFVAGLQHATIVAAVLAGLGAIAAAILIDRNHRKAEAPEPATPTPIAAEPVPVG